MRPTGASRSGGRILTRGAAAARAPASSFGANLSGAVITTPSAEGSVDPSLGAISGRKGWPTSGTSIGNFNDA